MSLQVWLPLNGNLNNQGLTNINAINNGATVNASGKIGSCYQFGTAASDITIPKEAMTSFTTEASVCFWIKILTWNTSYATFFQAGPASTAWTAYIFGLLRNNANSTCCFTISNGSSASNASYLTPPLDLNIWYHISLIYKTGHCLIYTNGQLYQDYTTSIVPNFSGITTIKLGRCTNGSSYQTNCQMNDFRIYNHALSKKEIEEISRGLFLHFKFDYAINNIIYDCSGYKNNGSLVSTPTFQTDTPRYSNAINMTAKAQKAKVSNLNLTGFANTFSISWWGKAASFSTGAMMWGFSNGNRLNGIYQGDLWNTGDGTSNPIQIPGTTTKVTAPTGGEWHYFVMTGDGTTSKAYLDGQLWGHAKTYKGLSGTEIYFNDWNSGTSYSFENLKLSDFRIYTTTLTDAQILELYNTSSTIDKSGNVYAREVIE